MTPSQIFLPKDRDGALHHIKAMLYARLEAIDIHASTSTKSAGMMFADIAMTEVQFLRILLDIIERS